MSKIYKIRQAKVKDLDNVIDLLYQLSPPKNSDKSVSKKHLKKTLKRIIKAPNHYIYVCVSNKKIIGTGTLWIQLNLSHGGRPYGHIENVVTDKNNREKGVGKKIVEYLIDKAKKADCYKIVLRCGNNNIPFYEKCGLNETGEVEMRIDN